MMPEIHPIDIDQVEQQRKDKEQRIELRREKIKKVLRRLYRTSLRILLLAAVLLTCIMALSFYIKGHNSGGLIKKTVVDFRACEIKIPGTEQSITGTRSYTYQYTQFAGWRFYNTSAVHAETKLDINGTQMTIIGNSSSTPTDKVWSKNIDKGERYSQLIQNEESYTIVYGDDRKVISVDYSSMCK